MLYMSLVVGAFQANCYLLGCPETREALVIDPGDEPARIEDELAAHDLKPVAYLLTHGHIDHVGAASSLKERLGGDILMHRADLFLYEKAQEQALAYGIQIPAVSPIDRFLTEGEKITWGKAEATVSCTPGHSPGGICLHVPGHLMASEEPGGASPDMHPDWVFTGDTLFQGSIGRTDLPGGSFEELMRSIKEKLLVLPDKTMLAPGHGPRSTIQQEKNINPFLQDLLG
ncbi:MAG: MBL fold metallo-hydrolase [Candidatus Eisenbacteria sp.]|nr:MBL fold metallo-hydrolase [Candidatus Eisenbacteria bacterium]